MKIEEKEALIQNPGRVFIEQTATAVKNLIKSVIPICAADKEGNAFLLGSAVLLAFAEDFFLSTAKHVLDENKTEGASLYIDGPTELVLLEGEAKESAPHDVSVIRLTSDQKKLLQKYSPLQPEQLATQSEVMACKYAQFVGFPATKNKQVYGKNELHRTLQSNGCEVLKTTVEDVRLTFRKKGNIDSDLRNRVTAPNPYGMSGGAIFGAVGSLVEPRAKLIGISTTRESSIEVSGTNIAIVLAIIRNGYNVALPNELNPIHINQHS